MKTYGLPSPAGPKLLRGALLWPSDDLRSCTLIDDGAVVIDKDGAIAARGAYADVKVPGIEEEGIEGVIAPAFADLHLHWVQHRVMGKFSGQLLQWLEASIWPAEAELHNAQLLISAADMFWLALLDAGTLCSAIYASSFEAGVHECLSRAVGTVACGDSIMTQACPESLRRDPEESMSSVRRLHAKWGDAYAVTPRFALSVGEELLGMLGAYARDHGLLVQTHLAENPDEVKAVAKAFPARASYTDVYDHAGLLGERTILAHCIHLDEKEWDTIADRRCIVAHCPSSNLALGSGRMNLKALRERDIDWVLASDIGAGPDLCQFDVIKAFLTIHQDHEEVSVSEAFARASVCAVPQRVVNGRLPASLMVLKGEAGSGSADEFLSELLKRYRGAGRGRDVIARLNLGGRWLY